MVEAEKSTVWSGCWQQGVTAVKLEGDEQLNEMIRKHS